MLMDSDFKYLRTITNGKYICRQAISNFGRSVQERVFKFVCEKIQQEECFSEKD